MWRLVSGHDGIPAYNNHITFRATLQQVDISVGRHEHLQVLLDWCRMCFIHCCVVGCIYSKWLLTWSTNKSILSKDNDLGRAVQIVTEAHIHSVVYSGQIHTSRLICVELYSELQVYFHLDKGVQHGLSWGLFHSVQLCPELSRKKWFADASQNVTESNTRSHLKIWSPAGSLAQCTVQRNINDVYWICCT